MSTPLEWIDTPVTPLFLPDLKDRTALITGSSQGIGKATTELLLQNGVRVFGLSLQRGDLKHPNLTEFECDLSDLVKTTEVFAEIARSTPQLDYVVNVAGLDPKYPIDDVTVAQWDYLLDVNLRAYYFVIKMALPLLRKGSGRSIVNVSSINYRLSVPGRAAYAATKAAILGLTTGLSRELGNERIRVNTVTPGWIFTERQVEEYFVGEKSGKHLDHVAQQQSLKLKISAAEIANHILFYLSSVSRASTAHNCVVDGGWLLE